MSQDVRFHSEGVKLAGNLYLPARLGRAEKHAGIVLCHGYTGVRNLYLPEIARLFNASGYVVLTFDYKGWGDSEGPKSRLAPYSRVADVQAALTFLGDRKEVDPDQLGLFGTSYGGSTVVWVAAVDPRVKCVISVVGVGNGARWMRSVRRPDEYHDLIERSATDRVSRMRTGKSEFLARNEILLPDRKSAELSAAARKNISGAISEIPLEYIDETLTFNAEWVVDKIAPRPVLFITTDDDRLVPPEESEAMYARAGEPKKLVVLKGYSHYEVYFGDALEEVMEASLAWCGDYLPAQKGRVKRRRK